MHDITLILNELEDGNTQAAQQLLPLVYEELRRLAAARLAKEPPGQTLQATALVHDAFLRLVDVEHQQRWNSRGHFFGAAAEAMRRILVENARRRKRLKRGGDRERVSLEHAEIAAPEIRHDLLALDEALDALAAEDKPKADLVKLRFFAGLNISEAAQALGISDATADRHWAYARAWLFRHIRSHHPDDDRGSDS